MLLKVCFLLIASANMRPQSIPRYTLYVIRYTVIRYTTEKQSYRLYFVFEVLIHQGIPNTVGK